MLGQQKAVGIIGSYHIAHHSRRQSHEMVTVGLKCLIINDYYGFMIFASSKVRRGIPPKFIGCRSCFTENLSLLMCIRNVDRYTLITVRKDFQTGIEVALCS